MLGILKKMKKIPLLVKEMSIKQEMVLVDEISDGLYKVKNIPAFVYGVGYEDTVKLISHKTGEFHVIQRSGNVTIRFFHEGSLDNNEIDNLIEKILSNKGVYEIGKNTDSKKGTSLLLISFPVSLGFENIEKLMNTFCHGNEKWEYGNIYSQNGDPLNWW